MGAIRRLLVANRGEIACRIVRTARRMGIRAIAVYSSADTRALHVAMADEAVCIGDPMPADSYLNSERILEAAAAAGADALHSGYGFLAENADFAAACIAQGLIFVGPPPDAIRAMGMKGTARRIMADAGVPVLPGINAVEGDIAEAASRIGFPLLIKPAAGGGGKGMKVVFSAGALDDAIASARREAQSAFGDDSLMLEKYLQDSRHVEVQVFADRHGNCIHLNERDCSLQRRHQKIIEEAPAPGMSAGLRAAMGDAAVSAAKAIGYVGAGTVEFLLGADNRFYFMEMNTRLQVEHPVTEAVTGFDLVQWQLEVAAGSPLPVSQAEVPLCGHAIEARLYAEDPLNDFLPVSGKIRHLDLPESSEHIRIDNGVQQGDHIGVYYDPMLMKIIASGESRNEAIERLRHALVDTRIVGIRTNRDFLCHMLDHAPFRQGALATDYLDRHLPEVFTGPEETKTRAHIAAAALALEGSSPGNASPWHTNRNFRLNAPHAASVSLVSGDRVVDIEVEQRGDSVLATFDGATTHCRLRRLDHIIELDCDDLPWLMHIYHDGPRLTLVSHSRVYDFAVPFEETAQEQDEGNVQAPMSGRITSIAVSPGQQVKKGAALVVIEAMKMEHTIRAPADGSVLAVHFAEGDLVDEGCELLEFEPVDTP